MKKQKIFIALFLVITMVLMSSCNTFDNFKEAFLDKGKGDSVIRIGVIEPVTGDDREGGKLEMRGIKIAHKLKPKVNGQDIELIYADTQSDIYATESATVDLISKKPALVLGSYGDAVTLVASSKLRVAKIPMIGITTQNPIITGGNEYFYKVGFSESSQGRALANFVYEKLEMDNVGIIKSKGEEIYTDMISQFTSEFKQLTNTYTSISVEAVLDPVEKNFTETLQQIKDSKAKAVFAPVSLTAAEHIFATAEKLGMNNVLFFGPKEWHTPELLKLKEKYPNIKMAAVSAVISDEKTADADEHTDEYDKLAKEYEKEYGSEQIPEAVVLGYDAYMLGVNTIENCQSTDPSVIKEALDKTLGYIGASGEISFNRRGEPHRPIHIDYIKDKNFVSIYSVFQEDDSDGKAGENNPEEMPKKEE